MPVIDPTDLLNLRPRSELLPRRYPVEGLRVEAGATVEAFRQELRLANIVCVGFNFVSVAGPSGQTIDAVPQFSNDGAQWRNVSDSASIAFIKFAAKPVGLESGLGYVQAFVGKTGTINLNPLGLPEFNVPAGARFFRVLLVSSGTASGVFDVIGTSFFL